MENDRKRNGMKTIKYMLSIEECRKLIEGGDKMTDEEIKRHRDVRYAIIEEIVSDTLKDYFDD